MQYGYMSVELRRSLHQHTRVGVTCAEGVMKVTGGRHFIREEGQQLSAEALQHLEVGSEESIMDRIL